MTRGLAVGVALLLGGYLLLTSTVTLHDTLWKFDVKRILELCLFPLIFTTVLFNRSLRTAFREQLEYIPRWVAQVLLVVLVLGLVSSSYNATSTLSLLYSLAEVALLTLLLLAVLAVAACRRVAGTPFDQVAIALLALVGLAVGLQELTGVFAALSIGVEFHPRIALLHFSWPRFYNQMQAWSIPVIAALPLVFPRKPLAKLFCVAALVLEWYVVIATGARGAMVGVAGALFAAVVFLPAIRKTLIQYQLAGLLGGILIYVLVVIGHQQLVDKNFAGLSAGSHSDSSAVETGQSPDQSADQSAAIQAMGDSNGSFVEPVTGQRIWTSSGRIAMWRETLLDARTHPLLGIGPMNYACTGPVYRAGHPHNFPLQFMVEWGIPAVLLLMFTSTMLLIKLANSLRTFPESLVQSAPLAGFYATGVVAAMILACLDGVLTMPASQVNGVLVFGCLLGLLPHQPVRRPANRTSNLKAPLALAIALLVSFAFLAFARQEIAVSKLRWDQTPVLDRGIPRLWQNGKVCALYQHADQRIWGQSKNSLGTSGSANLTSANFYSGLTQVYRTSNKGDNTPNSRAGQGAPYGN